MFVALLPLVLLACFILFFGASVLKFIIQNEGSSVFGRKLEMTAPARIDWDWRAPLLHLRGVRMNNAPDMTDPYMLEIEQVDMRVRIWKLLVGRTELEEVNLQNPRLILERTDETHNNWDFPVLSGGQALADKLPKRRGQMPEIGILRIIDGRMVYRDRTKGLDLDLTLDTAEGRAVEEAAGGLRVTGTGALHGQSFSIKAQGGGISILRDTSRPYPLELDIQMGPTHASFQGTLDDPIQMKGVDGTLEISGHTLSDLFYLTTIPLPPTPPYDLHGTLKKENDTWRYESFSGKVGSSDLAGDLTYDTSLERDFLKAELLSKRANLADLGGFIGVTPGKPATQAPEQKRQKARERASPFLLPDTPIDLERLRASDMDVTFKVGKLISSDLPFNSMDLRFQLREGLMEVDPMRLTLADGVVTGKLTLDGRKDTPHVTTNLEVQKLKLSRFFEGSRFERESSGDIGGHIELAGDGRSLAQILSVSDGRIVVMMQGGAISLLLIQASDLDVAQAVPLLLGEDKSTDIRCGIGDFTVKRGHLTSRNLVLDTTDTNLQGRAEINLDDELIDAELEAHPKNPSPLSLQGPVNITGSLKHPQISIINENTSARTAAAVVLGAVLTPLASILPFVEIGLGKDSNCHTLAAEAKTAVSNGKAKLQ